MGKSLIVRRIYVLGTRKLEELASETMHVSCQLLYTISSCDGYILLDKQEINNSMVEYCEVITNVSMTSHITVESHA